METALQLAMKGVGKTSPNPAVGAVIVKRGRVIGRGYHKRAGGPHAEVNAIKDAGNAAGADMYVTLEPCDHSGKTPPCTDAIISTGIKRVFIGARDPNPSVSGRGIRRLRSHGIEVRSGILREDCTSINEAYNKYITTRIPFVTLKLAATIDGRIATSTGESKWITGEPARKEVHRMRSKTDGVMVGIGTVLSDDPLLTTRYVRGGVPVRIVADTNLKIPLDSRLLGEGGRVVIATTRRASLGKARELEGMGAEVLFIPAAREGVSIGKLLATLGRMEITSLLIEGGPRIAASALREGVVDKVVIFFSPRIIGGDGIPMIGRLGTKRLNDSLALKELAFRKIGKDTIAEGYL